MNGCAIESSLDYVEVVREFFRNDGEVRRQALQDLDELQFCTLKESKRWFGLLSHKCPDCNVRLRLYKVLVQRRRPNGELTPKQVLMYPRDYSDSLRSPSPLDGQVLVGRCENGHVMVRLPALNGGSDGDFGQVYWLFEQGKMTERLFVPRSFQIV